VEHQHLTGLVTNRVPESFDLDYKRELYAKDDKGRDALANDVAALANTAGGILILGIVEDRQTSEAAAALGVPLSDAEERRMRQIIGSRVVPLPDFDVITVKQEQGHGFYVITVNRSVLAPHAVIVDSGLKYPRRNGSTTRHLSEPEVADAYRERFVAARRQSDRAEQVEQEGLRRLNAGDRACWVVVSLVPDFPGNMIIDDAARQKFQAEVIGRHASLARNLGYTWDRAAVGRRRVMAGGYSRTREAPAERCWTELHADGSGFYAVRLVDMYERMERVVEPPAERLVADEALVVGIMSGVQFLARHARDRAAAGGEALIRVMTYPVQEASPLHLGHTRGWGSSERIGSGSIKDPDERPIEHVALIDDLAGDARVLASATHLLATDLFQMFGWPECHQFTRDGQMRRPFWGSSGLRPVMEKWAAEQGIEITD
jgi:hypothetical protein